MDFRVGGDDDVVRFAHQPICLLPLCVCSACLLALLFVRVYETVISLVVFGKLPTLKGLGTKNKSMLRWIQFQRMI